MGRCYHLVYLLTIGVLFLSLGLVTCQPDSCFSDAKLKVLEMFYNGDISNPYTCDDMQYIQHGIRCNKKCYSVTDTLRRQFGCNPSFVFPQCPIRPTTQLAPVADSECDTQTVSCTPGSEYRTIDGSCNNLQNPVWGKSERGQNRLVPNAYDDGRNSPRTMGCSGELPSARRVSNIIHRADDTMEFDPRLSYMMMQMGQFLAHEMVLTELVKRSDGDPMQCCKEDINNADCFPIKIPEDDPHFPSGACMNFGRSKARLDCNDVRQQQNSQTAYLDLSMVYGATDKEATFLRTFQGGLLKNVNTKLPVDKTDELCELSRPQHIPDYYCTYAGDERVNEQPGLASIHTIMLREHNRLAEGLGRVNPHWDDERLYQEARKINIAQWQNIIYSEYLPLVLGPFTMRKYNLGIKRYGYDDDTYNPRVDATIINSFAVAAFRYGHSLVHRTISMMGFDMQEMIKPEPLQKMFFEPTFYHSNSDGSYGLEHILLWTSTTKCPFSDRMLEPSIQKFLFLDKNNDSLDLASVNIQRGRDHGIPGYNEFRRVCRLSEVTNFGTGMGGLVDHEQHVADLFQQAYSCPEDIDLYSGFLSERRSPGSILGPTGQCLVAMQFKRLRDGDRYFFARRDFRHPWIGFSRAQLREIKRVKMSALFCLNTSFERLQRNVFMQPDTGTRFSRNRLEDCNTRFGINLNFWRDRFM